MDILRNFELWNEHIFKAQVDNNLQDLSDLIIENETSSTFISKILNKKQPQHQLPYSIFKIHDEILAITKDIKYITGILFCLRPYIINTEAYDGRYLQNLADRRYLIYCTFGLQSVYNFWDRIGDTLHLYFPTNIKGDVYFGRVKDAIPHKYKTEYPYQQLIILYNEVEKLLALRNEAIHHFQMETKYRWGAVEYFKNKEQRTKLNSEKFDYPERFKRTLEISQEAFIQTLNLIDLLPNKSISS